MLILFDIDQTLIETGNAGLRAIRDAGRTIYGDHFSTDGIEVSGRLDPGILADILNRNGVESDDAQIRTLRAGYHERMTTLILEQPRRVLPGALELVRAVTAAAVPTTSGLLTGNFEETGRLKLNACGIDADAFPVRVWGDLGSDPRRRDTLPPVAVEQWSAHTGQAQSPEDITIIGDTVHDVTCALAHGCRALGVATGRYTRDQLVDAGAHRVVDTLEDTDGIMAWLMDHR